MSVQNTINRNFKIVDKFALVIHHIYNWYSHSAEMKYISMPKRIIFCKLGHADFYFAAHAHFSPGLPHTGFLW
jgi:hypothetical protein